MRKTSKTTYSDAGGDLRLPPRFGDLQVNACRNPACSNFAIAALPKVDRGRPRIDGSSKTDGYVAIGKDGDSADKQLLCQVCRKTSPIKSNSAVAAEVVRLSNYLTPQQEPGCPTPNCENAAMGVYTNPHAYVCKRKRKTSRRLECKSCRKGFSVKDKASAGQRKPHENKTIFKEIVSKKPIRGIAAMTELSPKAVYDKIDFIYAQCLGFVGEREARAHRIRRKYIRLCVDHQDYMINWKSRKARKNIQFTSICTVEGKTGYVLGHHLNYDLDIDLSPKSLPALRGVLGVKFLALGRHLVHRFSLQELHRG